MGIISKLLHKSGLEHYKDRNWRWASLYFRLYLRMNPADLQVVFALGDCFIKMGRLVDALARYLSVRRHHPNNLELLNRLGLLFIHCGNIPEAMAVLEHAVKVDPTDEKAHYSMALALEHNGQGKRYGKGARRERAVIMYEKVLRLNKQHTDALFNLGMLYEFNGQWTRFGSGCDLDRALSCFMMTSEYKLDDDDIHFHMGVIFCYKGKLDRSLNHFRCISHEQYLNQVHYNRAVQYLQKGMKSEAILEFDAFFRNQASRYETGMMKSLNLPGNSISEQ